jgi:TonB family protein
VTAFGSEFLRDFAKSPYLVVKSDEGTVVTKLALKGSAAGLSQLRRCVAHLETVAAAEAREKARFAQIPEDPFATIKGEATTPQWQDGAASLIRPDDYPASAQVNREQGLVRFRLTVGTTGQVVGCEVLQSSGSSALDSATCNIMRRRAKFTPARSATGKPVEGFVEEQVRWSL